MINVMHLGLTYQCNMKCKHCYVQKSKDILTLDDFKKILEISAKNGVFVLYYTFGEPLLSPYIFDLIEFSHKLGYVQTLMTNGYLINERIAKQLKLNGINNVYISIDSIFPKKHDENRGLNGAFEKAIKAIKILSNNNISVGISTTIRNENLDEILEIVNLALTLNIKCISLLRKREDNNLNVFKKENEKIKYSNKNELKQEILKRYPRTDRLIKTVNNNNTAYSYTQKTRRAPRFDNY